ncbi:MAG: hypothetical protein ACOY31_04445 [Bacillota bacterium]
MDFKYLYQLTSGVTPLKTDCGLLCGSVCCRPDSGNTLGVYLFPGEEEIFPGKGDWFLRELHDPEEYGFPSGWKDPVHFIKCTGPCPREARPLACRFFPLAPHLLTDGTILLIHDTIYLPYSCPLIVNKTPLEKDFIEAVALSWTMLLEDRRILELVEEDSREREQACGSIPPIIWHRR